MAGTATAKATRETGNRRSETFAKKARHTLRCVCLKARRDRKHAAKSLMPRVISDVEKLSRFRATSWWCAQSCETGLHWANSLPAGKTAGNFSIFDLLGEKPSLKINAFSGRYG